MQKSHQLPAAQSAAPPCPEAPKSKNRQFPSLGLPQRISLCLHALWEPRTAQRTGSRLLPSPPGCAFHCKQLCTEPDGTGSHAPGLGGLCCREEGSPSPICAAEGGDGFPPVTLFISCRKLGNLTQSWSLFSI